MAKEKFDDLPLLVVAASQTSGRGRSGAGWDNADRALAVSLVFRHEGDDVRPFSLMAGVAAVRALPEATLKWPNDVLSRHDKVGGILTERADGMTVVGMGVNLWWREPVAGAGSLFSADPGPDVHAELGALWGAELMDILDRDGWPADEYRDACETLGAEITWEPDGRGIVRQVAEDGGLVVATDAGTETLYSGAVRHVRSIRDPRSPDRPEKP